MANNSKQAEILNAVMTVKKKAYEQYRVYKDSVPDKLCQWCTSKIDEGAFCSEDCELKHQQAVEEYEARRADKDHRRYSR